MREDIMKSKPCKEKRNLFEILSEAEDDVKAGRIAPVTDTFENLRKFIEGMHSAVVIDKNLS